MKLYLVRHGETDWNVEYRAQGYTDIPLNPNGIAQAEKLRDDIKNRGLRFDAVYSSPLQRTLKTAQIITDGQYDLILDDRLKERNLGELEGKVVEDWGQFGVDLFDPQLNANAFNVEPIRDFQERTESFLDELRQEYPRDARILVVTSNGYMKRIHFILCNDYRDIPKFHNAEIYEYDI